MSARSTCEGEESPGPEGLPGASRDPSPRQAADAVPSVEQDAARGPAAHTAGNHDALLRAALDHISQGLSVVDSDLRVVVTNKRLFELLDFPPDLSTPGTPFESFMRYNAERGEYGPGDADKLTRERVDLARKFRSHYLERTRPNGLIIAVQGDPLPQGGFVSVYTDITEQRRHERELEERSAVLEEHVKERTAKLVAMNQELRKTIESQKKMESALVQARKMEAVGRIAGGLAHDFNNLLTVILGNLGALMDKYKDWEDIADHLQPAIRAARRGADTTRQLLAFARRQPLQPIPVDVQSLITDLVPLLRRSMSEVEIVVAANTDDGRCWALADPHMLENALLNLAMNARDAMPGGGQLCMELESASHDGQTFFDARVTAGDYVQVRVRDTGCGIDPDILSKVFEPFVTTKVAGSGTGLGLSLVYGFVKQSGGYIKIDSQRGEGTCVTFLLPRTPSYGSSEALDGAPRNDFGEGGGRLVLLVEDEEDVRAIVRRQLSEHGYLVIEARDGQQAKHLVGNVRDIALLVSDVVLPGGMSGIDLARHVRATRPEIRSVLISGIAEWVERGQTEDFEFPILRKPFDKSELLTLITTSG
jgi:Signal transduction histidine kinase regulating C4-dicarboxylate transport system